MDVTFSNSCFDLSGSLTFSPFMLSDVYLPQFNEVHSILVKGRQDKCYIATLNLDLSKSRLCSFLFRLRGLPFHNTILSKFAKEMKFILLDEIKYSEFIYAFWLKYEVEWVEKKEDFQSKTCNYNAKVVWSFSFDDEGNGKTKITTETRIFCLNKKTKILFSIYWFFIKPFSGLIRSEMLTLIKKEVEVNANVI